MNSADNTNEVLNEVNRLIMNSPYINKDNLEKLVLELIKSIKKPHLKYN